MADDRTRFRIHARLRTLLFGATGLLNMLDEPEALRLIETDLRQALELIEQLRMLDGK